MAVKISELPSGDIPLTGTEQIPVVQDGTTKAITTQDIVELTGVDNKQAADEDLSGLSLLTGIGYVKKTGAGTYAVENLVFLTSETDPVFSASAAAGITGTNITNWDSAFSWGNHSLAGYQSTLVSGTNIKTLNGSSLLGSGDITVSGGAATGAELGYDNSTSGLTSTDVQGAIDEIAASSGGGTYTNYVQPFLRRATHRFFPGKSSDAQVSTRSMAGNMLYLIPFVAPRDMAIVDAALHFDFAGVSFQVGIYENQFSAGEDSPGTRIAHASATSVAGPNVVPMSATLSAGNVYWLAFAMPSNDYMYALADGDGYAVFGTNATSSWGATHSYAFVSSTSTVPSTVSSASMVITGGSRPAILLGE